MSIKDLFNSRDNHDQFILINEKIEELDQKIKKWNTINPSTNQQLIKLEQQISKIDRLTTSKIRELERKQYSNEIKTNPLQDDEVMSLLEDRLFKKLEDHLFKSLKSDEHEVLALNKRLNGLEHEIENLKNCFQTITIQQKQLQHSLQELKEKQNNNENNPKPIIVQRINVETVKLDKYELNNNFGQLGIKELSGSLNIGATYGSGVPFPFEGEEHEQNEENDSETDDQMTEIPIQTEEDQTNDD